MDWSWQDFLFDEDVVAMSAECLGLYVRLLGRMWLMENPGRVKGGEEAIARMAEASQTQWQEHGSRIMERLAWDGNFIVHDRIQRDYQEQTKRVEIKRSAGKQGASKRWADSTSHDSANGSAMRLPMPPSSFTPSSLETPKTRSRKRDPVVLPEGEITALQAFDEVFWPRYPRKVAKEAARASWARLKLADDDDRGLQEIVDALAWYRTHEWADREPSKIPHASTWLNQRRFKDLEAK